MREKLKHKNVYEDNSKIAVKLPLTEDLKAYHKEGYFPLVEDPLRKKETAFIGMFVLRPGRGAWTEPVVSKGEAKSMYKIKGWVYNVRGFDGGALIANKNLLDAYRLALQYGIADAVFVGSATAAAEGVPRGSYPGYVWHPYGPTNWEHLKKADSKLLEKIMAQRKLLQEKRYLSERKYPAQVVVTQSGNESDPDILQARIFHDRDPEGERIEAYILTSEVGAEKIRARAAKYGLEDRIEDILIPLSTRENKDMIDLKKLPKYLFKEKGIIIANHDGGAKVLSEFAKAGILQQINLTLARKNSVYDILSSRKYKGEDKKKQQAVLEKFDEYSSRFFGGEDGRIMEELVPAHVIVDEIDEVAVVAFDARRLKGKGFR